MGVEEKLDKILENQREIMAMIRASNNWLWPEPERNDDALDKVADQ